MHGNLDLLPLAVIRKVLLWLLPEFFAVHVRHDEMVMVMELFHTPDLPLDLIPMVRAGSSFFFLFFCG